ncbi:unnamed protein product [Rhizophagus irregularis]|nr:unnamed protein product [Rhizophagus irregularis]
MSRLGSCEALPLVSLSSDLANFKTRSWLKSALWCLSQVMDPFYNFQFTWTNLKKMGLVANTGKTLFWFRLIDSSNSLIFRRVFYTIDDNSEIHVVYFSHWIPTTYNQMQITPCPRCFLHCLVNDESPLALKSVGEKLLHRSCLSVLPSYHCLQLF